MTLEHKPQQILRGLLLHATPFQERSWIGPIFTREFGVLHACWQGALFSPGRTVIGVGAKTHALPPSYASEKQKYSTPTVLIPVQTMEILTTFNSLLEYPHGALILTLFSLLIERTQSQGDPRPAFWDLTLYLLSKISTENDRWKAALTFFGLIALETAGYSVEELLSMEESIPQEVTLTSKEADELIALLSTSPKEVINLSLTQDSIFKKAMGFIGMKLEEKDLMEFAKEGT